MARAFSEEKRNAWKKKILEQEQSGLSIPKWCKENKVIEDRFRYWKRTLFPKVLDRSSFTELPQTSLGGEARSLRIQIECRGVTLSWERGVKKSDLAMCLKALKEVLCWATFIRSSSH